MKRLTSKTLVIALALVALGCLTVGAQAQVQPKIGQPAFSGPPAKLLLPGPPPAPAPRLGFNSYFRAGGEYVVSVNPWGRAARIGLEPGDVIVSINGQHLCNPGSWYRLMRIAAAQGRATLGIRDCRSGWVVYRTVHFWGQPGPIMAKSARR